jgi:hypothetical protein
MRKGRSRRASPPFAVTALLAAAATAQAPSPPASAIRTDTLVVRGRCVDFDTGAPLQRCRVRLTGHQSTGYPIAWSRADWADPPEQTTGADGTFRFEVRLPAPDEPLDRGRYHLRIDHAHHAGWFAHCAFVVAQDQGGVDHGDVRLPKGSRPRLRCEDGNGAAQPGVLIDLRRASAPDGYLGVVGTDGPQWWLERGAYGRTDVDGQLHLDGPLPAGDYTLAVPGREIRTAPRTITLPADAPVVAVVEPIAAEHVIAGRLVDDGGMPVAGATLSDRGEGGNQCVTRRDGAFTLVRKEASPGDAPVLYLAQNRRFDGWRPLEAVAWGSRAVELVVAAPALRTFVVRTRGGAVVEDFNLYCLRRGGENRGGERLAGTFPGGRATVRLPAGTYELLVAPRTDRLLATGWQRIELEAGAGEMPVVLDDAAARTVEVRFAGDGTPAAGALVEAIVGGAPGAFDHVRPATLVDAQPRRGDEHALVASALTDTTGRATLYLREPGPLSLRVSGAGVRTVVHDVDLAGAREPAPLTVDPGATLLGTIGPLAALHALDPERAGQRGSPVYKYHSATGPTLTFVPADPTQRREGVRIDTAGRFRCDGLPPGPVEVLLTAGLSGHVHARDGAPPRTLGTFVVKLGEPHRVTLEVPAAGAPR